MDWTPRDEADVDYQLVCCRSLDGLRQRVRMLSDAGWRPCDGVGGGAGAYYQTVIRFLR